MILPNIILSLSDHHLYAVVQWCLSLTSSCNCASIIYLILNNGDSPQHHLVIVRPSFIWCCSMMFIPNIILSLCLHYLFNFKQWWFSLTSSCHCLTIIIWCCTMMFLPNIIMSLSDHHLYNIVQWCLSPTSSCHCVSIIYLILSNDISP